MKVNFKRFFRGMIAMLSIFTVMIASIPVYANEETLNVDFCNRYVTVNDQKMHVVLYGDIHQTGDEVSFSNPEKTTLVMLPGLGEVSPHLSFKPLAQQLDSSFNVVIVEPFGYGPSDLATTTRSVENINSDLTFVYTNNCPIILKYDLLRNPQEIHLNTDIIPLTLEEYNLFYQEYLNQMKQNPTLEYLKYQENIQSIEEAKKLIKKRA